MRRMLSIGIAVYLGFVGSAWAADHFIGGDYIKLKDPTGDPAKRRATFRAAKDPAIVPDLSNDPRIVGAQLEITGTNPGDGSTGIITLAQAGWTGLGNPSGSKGYKWVDPTDSLGVRRVLFRNGNNGGKLIVVGRESNWMYQVTQAQGPILVRFTVGTENYCAQFLAYARNQAELVIGRNALAPVSCTITCGNGTVDGIEECDDGGNANGDGCDSTCQLENTSAVCAGIPTTAGTALHAVRIANGLTLPNTIAAPRLDPNRLFVVEKTGRIRLIKNGSLLPTAFLNLSAKVTPGSNNFGSEQGLLGLAFHPNYESNGRFFVNYTDLSGDTVVSRFQVSGNPDIADTTETILLTISQPFANHNGGNILFGPDGYLYVGMGDGGSGGDPLESGQTDATLLGKMLRLDVDVNTAPFHAAPASNPHFGDPSPFDLIWAKGLRNPWRFSFDRANGDLYIADVGQGSWEEIDWVPGTSTGAENYGWDIFEGTHCYDPEPDFMMCPAPGGYVMPVVEYDHGVGCSTTGGFVYRGCAMPDLHGTYFYSDYCTAFIRTFEISGGAATNEQDRTADVAPGGGLSIDSVVSFGEDARGEMYIADQGGEIFKIVPQP